MAQNNQGWCAVNALISELSAGSLSLKSSAELSDGLILYEITSIIKDFKILGSLSRECPNWITRLSNLKLLVKSINYYYTNVLGKDGMSANSIDLMDFAKNNSEEAAIKLFEYILGAAIQSSSKQKFIEKILALDKQYQFYFASILQKTLVDTNNNNNTSIGMNDKGLLDTLQSLDRENIQLEKEVAYLLQANEKITQELKQAHIKIDQYTIEMESMRNSTEENIWNTRKSLEDENQDFSNQQRQLLQTLKEKIVEMSVQHEAEIQAYKDEVANMQNQQIRIGELETMVEMYKDNYEDALNHLNKINLWQKEKQKLTALIAQKSNTIIALEEAATSANNKINRLQEELLDSQMEYEKLSIKYKQIENNVKKSIKTYAEDNKFDSRRQALSTLCPLAEGGGTKSLIEDKDIAMAENQRELDRKQRKIKELEKENQRLKERSNKLTQLEKEKMKLETMLVDMVQSRGEQVQILSNVLYQMRMKYEESLGTNKSLANF